MNKISVACVAIAILFLSACNNDKEIEEVIEKPPTQMELWDCHTQAVWHTETVFDELVGKWKWFYTQSYGLEENGSNTEIENMVIEFQKDSVLNIYIDGNMESTSIWSVILTDPPLFGLALDSAINQLYGRILFCNDIVEFNNSYIDGDDNYFRRIE